MVSRNIYKTDLLPPNTRFIGYARSDLSVAQLREKVQPFLKVRGSVMLYIDDGIHRSVTDKPISSRRSSP